MDFDFLELAAAGVRGLQPYQAGKPIDELEREYGVRDAIKLASNENPLGPSPLALEAVRRAAGGLAVYPDGNGFRLKRKLATRHGVDVAQITLGNGSSDPLEFIVRVFAGPGDEVLYSQHSFSMYPIITQAAGATGVEAPARDWGYDLGALAGHITPRTKVVFIANPNNPTGTWVGRAELEAFIATVPQRVLVVVDEAYFEYAAQPATGAEEYPDAMAWVNRFPHLVVARTFSKAYGLAGLRVGYAVSHPQVADLLNRVRPPFNVNVLALAAAEAALDDVEHLERSVALNVAGLGQLAEGFATLGLEHIPSVGNFVSVNLGRPAGPVYEALLRQGVIVRPVAGYGMPEHLRITVGTAEQNRRVLTALETALRQTAE